MTNNNLYANADARFDTVVGPNEYYILLRKIRHEFDNMSSNYSVPDHNFLQYVENQYGIRPMFDTTYQAITAEFTVVDKDKYLLARLKFA